MNALDNFSREVRRLSRAIRVSLIAMSEAGVFGKPRIIYDRAGKSPYLSRFYLVGAPSMRDGRSPINELGNLHPEAITPPGIGVYVHRFHRSDDDRALHNHPWRWAISLILAGGYREEKRVVGASGEVDRVEMRDVLPGDINVLTSDTYHRVDLFEEDAWSLFIVGPKFASWGFWDRQSGLFKPWRQFINEVREGAFASKGVS